MAAKMKIKLYIFKGSQQFYTLKKSIFFAFKKNIYTILNQTNKTHENIQVEHGSKLIFVMCYSLKCLFHV